ncbi:MAG: hypothetical protein WC530_10510 [Candidatus Omnitrophota bacterium]|jgi:hypothetical protein
MENDRIDFADVLKRHMEEQEKLCWVEDDCIVFPLPGGTYDIGINRCSTASAILELCVLLGDKTWITKEHLLRFIFLATQQNKIGLFGLSVDSK